MIGRKQPAGPRPSLWLLQFGDLVSLMLTFFVLLYSMSHPQPEWGGMTAQINARDRAERDEDLRPIDGAGAILTVGALEERHALNLSYLGALIERQVAVLEDLDGVGISREDDQLIVSLPERVMFAPGASEPSPGGNRLLERIAQVLKPIGNRVMVIGHTDPTPLRDPGFRSNWTLSLARAQAVARELGTAGYDQPIMVIGRADADFAEIDATGPRDQVFSMARRVDLVIDRRQAESEQ